MVRVYILANNDLFGEGVVNLLRLEPEVEIVGQGTDSDSTFEEIKRLLPEAVIVETNYLLKDPKSIVTHVLDTETPVKVISLDLRDNKFHLYHGEEREIRGVEDLVDAIKTELSPSHHAA